MLSNKVDKPQKNPGFLYTHTNSKAGFSANLHPWRGVFPKAQFLSDLKIFWRVDEKPGRIWKATFLGINTHSRGGEALDLDQ